VRGGRSVCIRRVEDSASWWPLVDLQSTRDYEYVRRLDSIHLQYCRKPDRPIYIAILVTSPSEAFVWWDGERNRKVNSPPRGTKIVTEKNERKKIKKAPSILTPLLVLFLSAAPSCSGRFVWSSVVCLRCADCWLCWAAVEYTSGIILLVQCGYCN
jgi:hypothetical protein